MKNDAEMLEHELIELGMRRPNLYIRQRTAIEEMEGLRNVTKPRSNHHTTAGTYSMRL